MRDPPLRTPVLICDFVYDHGQRAGLIITFVPTSLILSLGFSAALEPYSTASEPEVAVPRKFATTKEDGQITLRIVALLQKDGL